MPINNKRIAFVGGGPSALFLLKNFLSSGHQNMEIDIFERKNSLGSGMPYSDCGANDEHITNVSGNEIPTLVTSIQVWVKTLPPESLVKYAIDPNNFNEYRVLPRLLFGKYLSAQFDRLLEQAKEMGVVVNVHLESVVEDISDKPKLNETWINVQDKGWLKFDFVVICSGHYWPQHHEGRVKGFFDSPYPPSKLRLQLNHAIAIRGSSLTAIDAIRTLSRNNGVFNRDEEGRLSYRLLADSPNFKLTMHTRSGLLPSVRFHLEDSHLSNDSLLTPEEIAEHMSQNEGFLSLDYIFDKNFKAIIQQKEPEFYDKIKDMNMEAFVAAMMELRERLDPFVLLKAEYEQAAKSIKRKETIYWKEMLGVLSFAMNYPAKYLSAEDMQRLQSTLIPLISIVIAYVPQSSCEELMALHEAGVLKMITVDADSEVLPDPKKGGVTYQGIYYPTYVDCVGQPHLSYAQFPFKGLQDGRTISKARLRYQSPEKGRQALAADPSHVEQGEDGTYYQYVSGMAINDSFQVLDPYGAYHPRIYLMAVPYIGGLNPDYSGLDFCEEASKRIGNSLLTT